jgi:UDP-N-acetylglucosamine 2-epimerase
MQPLATHVLGARPNFMKAAPVIRALGEADVDQTLIHTGQRQRPSSTCRSRTSRRGC